MNVYGIVYESILWKNLWGKIEGKNDIEKKIQLSLSQ